jgi:hypothetical protein
MKMQYWCQLNKSFFILYSGLMKRKRRIKDDTTR